MTFSKIPTGGGVGCDIIVFYIIFFAKKLVVAKKKISYIVFIHDR